MDFLNIIVANEFMRQEDRTMLFGNEPVHIVGKDTISMYRLLVLLGAFPSISQAKKNWKKTGASIPPGWSEFFIGRKKRWLCIWNPTE